MKTENKTERIKKLRKEINYEKRKMKVCAYGSGDLKYLWRLENELTELLENKK